MTLCNFLVCLCLPEENEQGLVTGSTAQLNSWLQAGFCPWVRLVGGYGKVWAQAKRVSAKVSFSLPESSLSLYPVSQGLLPTQQGWDRVLDQEAKSAWTSSWFCQLGKLMSAHQSHSC